jgi:hypothetical protein
MQGGFYSLQITWRCWCIVVMSPRIAKIKRRAPNSILGSDEDVFKGSFSAI